MSTKPRIYLDFNATAPLGADVRVAMTRAMGAERGGAARGGAARGGAARGLSWGNPSSIHAEGRRARDAIEQARERVARLAGRPREQLVFTSGGTEGNALGVIGLAAVAERRGLPRVVASAAIDHPSLRGAVTALVARGWRAAPIAVTAEGALEAHAVNALDGAGLVAVAAANHELGTLAGSEVIAAARAAGALVHVDAVQAAGKIALAAIDADALVLSAHKLGGPQGVGALAIACDEGLPLIDAGHQERGRRPGTENALGIIGFGAAAEGADPASWPAVAALGERLEAGLRALDGVRIHGAGAPRVGGTVNAGFAGARGESLVIALDLAGIAVSTGAACTSGAIEPSPVLLAIGQSPERAREAVRFSLGRTTTAAEIDAVLEALPPIVARARRHRG